jgi:hypothetical protein
MRVQVMIYGLICNLLICNLSIGNQISLNIKKCNCGAQTKFDWNRKLFESLIKSCVVMSPHLLSKLGDPVSIVGRTSARRLTIIEENVLPKASGSHIYLQRTGDNADGSFKT